MVWNPITNEKWKFTFSIKKINKGKGIRKNLNSKERKDDPKDESILEPKVRIPIDRRVAELIYIFLFIKAHRRYTIP